ncbi:MAG: class I fructose-bisphosphate aldolase [Candidatus Hatepunaea meridiana]|nr:class I fructose-bisphosphate aldolase [Candidatus Hatepunaea meridiana]
MSNIIDNIVTLLGDSADELLNYQCTAVPKDQLNLPGPDFIERVVSKTDRPPSVLRNLQTIYDHGRLAGTGYVSVLPVDQGIEHSGGASFAPNPIYFDPDKICELAYEGGCNAVASTLGVLGAVSRKWAHKIPFIVKLNHNEFLSYPNSYDQIMFGSVRQSFDLGALAVGATIYFGSPESNRQIQEVSEAFAYAHEMGMVTILWCYMRNSAFNVDGVDYHSAADLTGQANHLGVTIEADIIKQKLPNARRGYEVLNDKSSFGKYSAKMYTDLMSDNPIDLVRYQVVNNYMGRAGLINSGGSSGDNDFADACLTAVCNKRGGGMGLISGRKAFQRPMEDGIKLLNTIQDVYGCEDVTVA